MSRSYRWCSQFKSVLFIYQRSIPYWRKWQEKLPLRGRKLEQNLAHVMRGTHSGKTKCMLSKMILCSQFSTQCFYFVLFPATEWLVVIPCAIQLVYCLCWLYDLGLAHCSASWQWPLLVAETKKRLPDWLEHNFSSLYSSSKATVWLDWPFLLLRPVYMLYCKNTFRGFYTPEFGFIQCCCFSCCNTFWFF